MSKRYQRASLKHEVRVLEDAWTSMPGQHKTTTGMARNQRSPWPCHGSSPFGSTGHNPSILQVQAPPVGPGPPNDVLMAST